MAKSTFEFVSNFEDLQLDGWQLVSGTQPTVVKSPNYSGEPSLKSLTTGGEQIETANTGFVPGLDAVSFQAAIHSNSSEEGLIGLATDGDVIVAVMGVDKGSVVAGPSDTDLTNLGAIPSGTAFPSGWVYLIANVVENKSGWFMSVFADQTASPVGVIEVPFAGGYGQGQIETFSGPVEYTNIIFSSYQMAIVIPGYNNMEGYGQGSALLVQKLPAYKNLTARMTLNSWSEPQANILSFQINAMNKTGTTQSTCVGFFQLGMDLNPGGKIAPWYVPGVDCEANYFVGGGGVSTPKDSQLILSILFLSGSHKIKFVIQDTSIKTTWSQEIPYSGGAFYGAYTQMEFQPCCNNHSINDYTLKGSLFDLTITTTGGKTESLPASYMLPFSLDTPTSWDITYYQNSIAGYVENNSGA